MTPECNQIYRQIILVDQMFHLPQVMTHSIFVSDVLEQYT